MGWAGYHGDNVATLLLNNTNNGEIIIKTLQGSYDQKEGALKTWRKGAGGRRKYYDLAEQGVR